MASEGATFTLSELQEAVALALVGYTATDLADSIPQDVWDRLHQRNLVVTGRDITGDGETYTTLAGASYLKGVLYG